MKKKDGDFLEYQLKHWYSDTDKQKLLGSRYDEGMHLLESHERLMREASGIPSRRGHHLLTVYFRDFAYVNGLPALRGKDMMFSGPDKSRFSIELLRSVLSKDGYTKQLIRTDVYTDSKSERRKRYIRKSKRAIETKQFENTLRVVAYVQKYR